MDLKFIVVRRPIFIPTVDWDIKFSTAVQWTDRTEFCTTQFMPEENIITTTVGENKNLRTVINLDQINHGRYIVWSYFPRFLIPIYTKSWLCRVYNPTNIVP